MYLLIRFTSCTFFSCCEDLHPTMYLLIQRVTVEYLNDFLNLHPTMYLLIRGRPDKAKIVEEIYIPLCIY